MFKTLRELGCGLFAFLVIVMGIVIWCSLLLYSHVIVPTFHAPPLKTTPLNGP